MASTNPFLTLYSTIQMNNVGSTIATGYIPYVSTAGRQAYSNTLSTLTVSTLTAVSSITRNMNYSTLVGSTLSAVSTVTGDINCSTITANTINGTSATSLATTSYADTAVANKITLGLNQTYYTWANLFGGTFAANTSYYNAYGRIMTIFVYAGGGSNASAQAWVGGSNLNSSDSAMVAYMYIYGASMGTTLQIVVPPYKYYIVRVANGGSVDTNQTYGLF